MSKDHIGVLDRKGLDFHFFTAHSGSWGKVMFSLVYVCPQGMGMPGPMSLLGLSGYAWSHLPSGTGLVWLVPSPFQGVGMPDTPPVHPGRYTPCVRYNPPGGAPPRSYTPQKGLSQCWHLVVATAVGSVPEWFLLITICNIVAEGICFHRHLSFCSQGEVSITACTGANTPPGQTPLVQTPPCRHPTGQTPPPLGRPPTRADTPPGRYPPGRHPPPLPPTTTPKDGTHPAGMRSC